MSAARHPVETVAKHDTDDTPASRSSHPVTFNHRPVASSVATCPQPCALLAIRSYLPFTTMDVDTKVEEELTATKVGNLADNLASQDTSRWTIQGPTQKPAESVWGGVPWLVVVSDFFTEPPEYTDKLGQLLVRRYSQTGADANFLRLELDMRGCIHVRPHGYPMVQLFGGGFVVHFLAAGPGWRAPEHQPTAALTETTCADLFHRLYEAAVMGCAPRSARLLLGTGSPWQLKHPRPVAEHLAELDLAKVLAAAPSTSTRYTALREALPVGQVDPADIQEVLASTQLALSKSHEAAYQAAGGGFLFGERRRAARLRTLAPALKASGATLPSELTIDRLVDRHKIWLRVEARSHVRLPRDVRWLLLMSGGYFSLRFPDPLRFPADYVSPFLWTTTVSKPVDFDDDDSIRGGLRDRGELLKDGMRRVVLDELIAVPDDAWWNPLQGAFSLGSSWLTADGEAFVALNGPGAGTVWLRDSLCDEDLLWPLGLQHSGIGHHGRLVDSHDHSLLDYITLRLKGRLASAKKESSHAGGAYT